MAMEPKERMLLEGVLVAVLIAFLILASIMIVSAYGEQDTKIINSYNTNSYNTNSFNTYSSSAQRVPSTYRTATTTTQKKIVYSRPYIVDRTDYSKIYYTNDDSRYRYYYIGAEPSYRDVKSYSDERYLRYDDSGNLRTYKGVIGNNVDSYEVYVRNREYTGGYFKTTFYFEDYSGKVDSQSQMYYIPPREEKTFVYRDVSPPAYKYRAWRYEVMPLDHVDSSYRMVYSDHSFPAYYSGYY